MEQLPYSTLVPGEVAPCMSQPVPVQNIISSLYVLHDFAVVLYKAYLNGCAFHAMSYDM